MRNEELEIRNEKGNTRARNLNLKHEIVASLPFIASIEMKEQKTKN
jgi:hypothetical protein